MLSGGAGRRARRRDGCGGGPYLFGAGGSGSPARNASTAQNSSLSAGPISPAARHSATRPGDDGRGRTRNPGARRAIRRPWQSAPGPGRRWQRAVARPPPVAAVSLSRDAQKAVEVHTDRAGMCQAGQALAVSGSTPAYCCQRRRYPRETRRVRRSRSRRRERHLRLVLDEYTGHCNVNRPHRAPRQGPPAGRPHPPAPGASARVLRRDRPGGLIHEYSQAALGDRISGTDRFVVGRFERLASAEVRTWWTGASAGSSPRTPIARRPAAARHRPDAVHCALIGSLGLPFAPADLARRADRVWRLIELGDGQVSDRPSITSPGALTSAVLARRRGGGC